MKVGPKCFVIPLTDNRHIILKFNTFSNNKQWACVVSDEFMNDMEKFFDIGHYKLNSEKQIEIYEDEE